MKIVFSLMIIALVFILVFIGYFIWFRTTHTCVKWETIPTGSYCAQYVTTTVPSGKTTVTITTCVRHEKCKECLQWIEDEKVEGHPKRPKDACP